MIGYGVRYGLLSTRRRRRALLLPTATTATGALLVVLVFSLAPAVRQQAAAFGHADQVFRATLLITILVLLTGVVEVAVCTTRAISQRTREIGVLTATGVPRPSVAAALLIEPVAAAAAGAVAGSVLAVAAEFALAAAGSLAAAPAPGAAGLAVALAVGVSVVSAALASILPSWRAASRPPIHSLSHGG
jgi:ABC-type antimicrobial peptide transport system permease subunit